MPCNKITIGCLKIDEYLYYNKNPNKFYNWNLKNEEKIKIVWKPRWTISKEDSNLFKYLKSFYSYIKKNKNIKFVFLMHPLLISTLKEKKHYKYFNKWFIKLLELDNFKTENSSNFLDCVLSADILIADHSSTIAEFASTGKPIIYTKTKTELNKLGKKIINKKYIVNNFTEIKKNINKLSINKLSYKQNNKQIFYTPPNGLSVAQYLLKIIYEDYNYSNLKIKHYFDLNHSSYPISFHGIPLSK